MPNQFNQGTVQQYGGVAWAKQQAEALSPQAIGDQIKAYNDVNTSLNNIVDTLNKANSSLQAAWSGDAATAATQTFSDTSNHAQNVITTVKNTITQLTTAQNAATTAQQAMRNVPDEKPVPSGGFFSGITNTVSDIFTGTDPVQQAQQHNLAARNQAADVLNKLSSSYETAANNMNTIAGSHDRGFTPTSPPPSGSFNLGSGSYSGGSGAAAGYGFTGGSAGGGKTTREPSFGGVTNGVFHEGTSLSHTGTVTPPPSSTPPGLEDFNTTTTTTTPGPIFGTPGGGLPIPPGEETSKPGGGSAFGDGLEEGGKTGTSKISSNVFGEEGFGDETGGGAARRTASNLGGNLEGEGGAEGGRAGGSAGGGAEGGQSAMRGAGGRRGGGSSGEEELGSSKYSRGKFFGGEEPGSGEEEWVQPSIGGNESLLVKDSGRGAGTGRVTSAYDGATDADGNPLRMARGVGRRGASRDEDDERGERPDYLKEDPEWWQSAQQVAPPVVD